MVSEQHCINEFNQPFVPTVICLTKDMHWLLMFTIVQVLIVEMLRIKVRLESRMH